LNRLQEKFPHAVAISATTGEGISNARRNRHAAAAHARVLELRIPHEQSAVIARLHKVGQVIERRYNGRTARFKARIPPHFEIKKRKVSFKKSRALAEP
jgi:50S ribosomal subunit-associated GTPase HflX